MRTHSSSPLLLLFLALCTAPQPSAANDMFTDTSEDLSKHIHELATSVAQERKLEMKASVTVQVESPTQVREKMIEEFDKTWTPEEVANRSLALHVWRMADLSLDLRQLYIDILEAQVGGYYDVETKRLVLVRRTEANANVENYEDMVAAHELVHALQDQNFDLYAMTNRVFSSDDAQLGVQALVEGDATLLMLLRSLSAMGVKLPSLDDDTLQNMLRMDSSSALQGPMAEAPIFIREELVFPYLHGMSFATQLYQAGEWSAITEAFSNPPLSTEQILHPDRYHKNPDWPVKIIPPAPESYLPTHWTPGHSNTLGELGFRHVLEAANIESTTAHSAADGWDGDHYQILVPPPEQENAPPAILWWSEWDSEAEAKEAAFILQNWLLVSRDLSAHTHKQRRKATLWRSKGPSHWLEQRGSRLLFVIDAPRNNLSALVEAAWTATSQEIRNLDDVSKPRVNPASSAPPEQP